MTGDDFLVSFFFFQAEDGIRDLTVTGVQTCALPILLHRNDVARLRRGAARRRDRRVSHAAAPLRRAAGSGGGMSATITARTRLGLEILGTRAALGVAGDAVLRAVAWGVNALLCTAGLVP